MVTKHIPVLFEEVMGVFAPVAGKVIVDGTLGGAGHARGLLARGASKVIGLDWDAAAIERVGEEERKRQKESERVRKEEGQLEVHHLPYDRMAEVVRESVDGVLLDLGFSSDQLDDAGRGLSYHAEGPLDMRLNSAVEFTAADILNDWREADLARIFKELGEEPKARVLANAVVRKRKGHPFFTTLDLLAVVEEVYPPRKGLKRAHPAARIFQALRIAVNDELAVLARALKAAAGVLKVGGRLAVISFQPAEERLVKKIFRELCADELDSVGRVAVAAKFKMGKKQMPHDAEMEINPRSRSAILRVLERLA